MAKIEFASMGLCQWLEVERYRMSHPIMVTITQTHVLLHPPTHPPTHIQPPIHTLTHLLTHPPTQQSQSRHLSGIDPSDLFTHGATRLPVTPPPGAPRLPAPSIAAAFLRRSRHHHLNTFPLPHCTL
ncbi:hypothetical protein E2C01_028699 [Portunus trituberculatus]|uniref:Uncharacterized protein n=1 Tax=Portunus trituberculatus TaxID=210409 RepID=A0A5B7EQ67_PORTR|nr:hypothetical protein [Portunus trituberculatus]